MRMRFALLVLLASLLPGVAEARAQSVRFPARAEAPDHRFDFAIELLRLCLAKSGAHVELSVEQAMFQTRAREAALRGEVDVVLLPNTATDTKTLVPVKLPIRRGLLGVRLLLARPETAEALMLVESTEELKTAFVMGYGRAWLDANALQALGFRMELASTYTGLFDMLRGGRFDYLSRGVNEVFDEREDPRLAAQGMAVVPGIALFYPLDDYFWVRPGAPALHAAIERGFLAALADGSYAALFRAHYGEAVREAGIEQRSILHVLGYPVPEDTPLAHFDVLELTRSEGRLVAPPLQGE